MTPRPEFAAFSTTAEGKRTTAEWDNIIRGLRARVGSEKGQAGLKKKEGLLAGLEDDLVLAEYCVGLVCGKI